ncbi:MAG: DUF349 domain-containing protein [Xanthomonadales bacterium]|nr:DUF349 domain-containing protein [Xanthomonadales bacterium]
MAKLKELLFKPKWQHKDARVRERSVAHEEDPRLVEALPDIARSDPSPRVRLQAVRRIHDLYHLMRIAAEDDDAAVRDAAYRGYRELLTGTGSVALDLEQRLELVPRLDDDDLIEHLARHAEPVEVRRAAVAKVRRQGLLGDIAIEDPDGELRRQALERIEQSSTLERVAEAVRKRDKSLHRAALARLERDSDAGGQLSRESITALCEEAEALSRSGAPPEEKAKRLTALETAWADHPEALRQPLQRRFDGACHIIRRTLEAKDESDSGETPELRALRSEFDAAIKEANELLDEPSLRLIEPTRNRLEGLRDPVGKELGEDALRRVDAAMERLSQVQEKLLAEQPVKPGLLALCRECEALDGERTSPRKIAGLEERWRKAWKQVERPSPNEEAVRERFNAALEQLREAQAKREEARETALNEIDAAVARLEERLDDGDLAQAAKAQQRINDLLDLIGHHPSVSSTEFKTRLHTARGRLHELRDWQHWANNKIRKNLCEEAEALPESGLHPDAVIAKIKSLRSQWRELNESEKLPGDNPKKLPAPGLYRRFQAACDRAFKPAKGFFEKRDEVRKNHYEELKALAERIEAAVENSDDLEWKDLEKLVGQGRGGLRRLPDIPPKRRGAMSRRRREGAPARDDRRGEHYKIVERRKERLIEEVEALDPNADLDAAINAAKDAQGRWRDAGLTRRGREQRLWKRFRAACDQVFDRLSEQRAEEKAEEKARLDAADDLLDELKETRRKAARAPEDARADLNRLQDQWRRQALHDRKRERIAQDLFEAIEADVEQALVNRELAERQALREITALCLAAEARWFDEDVALEKLRTDVEALTEGRELPRPLADRVTAAFDDPPGDLDRLAEENRQTGEELCVAAEFLAGIESPKAFRQQRMDYQVARLSRRMSGDDTQSLEDESAELESRWYECAPLDPDSAAALRERFERAMREIDAVRQSALERQ